MVNKGNGTLIRFTELHSRTKASRPCYLESVSFTGEGMTVRSMKSTMNIEKAARFSMSLAHRIAVQFSDTPATLTEKDGTVKVEETRKLQTEQLARHIENVETRRDEVSSFANLEGQIRGIIGTVGI